MRHGRCNIPRKIKFFRVLQTLVNWLYRENKNFIFLTNSSQLTPREYQQKLANLGIMIDDENRFYTSALATAEFIRSQNPRASAYVIGAGGLMNALYDAGITNNDRNPDYVIVGETDSYNYSKIVKAVTLVNQRRKAYRHKHRYYRPYGVRSRACMQKPYFAYRNSKRKKSIFCRQAKSPYNAYST